MAAMGDDFEFIPQAWLLCEFRSICWVLRLQVKSEVKPSNKRGAVHFIEIPAAGAPFVSVAIV